MLIALTHEKRLELVARVEVALFGFTLGVGIGLLGIGIGDGDGTRIDDWIRFSWRVGLVKDGNSKAWLCRNDGRGGDTHGKEGEGAQGTQGTQGKGVGPHVKRREKDGDVRQRKVKRSSVCVEWSAGWSANEPAFVPLALLAASEVTERSSPCYGTFENCSQGTD